MIDAVCALIAINFLFYFKTLRYKYSSDDIPAARRPKHPNKLFHWLGVLEGRARSTPQIDHALTLCLHTLAAVGVFLGFGGGVTAFIAAMLFSVNPATNQGSVWISGRSYVVPAIAMTFTLAFPVLAPVLLLLSAYYNAGFITPVVLLASPHPWTTAWLPFIWAIHWPRFQKNVGDKIKMEMFAEDKKVHWRKLVLATKTFGYYTVHALIPVRTTFYHAFLQSAAGCMKDKAQTMKDKFFLIGVAFILAFTTYFIFVPWNMVSFGLLWWCVCISPFLNMFRIHQEIAERYMYLPSIGLMYAVASVLYGHWFLFGLLFGLYATKMWFWMDAYEDDFWLVEASRVHERKAWFVWHVAAMRRWEVGSHKEAINFWVMARMISPKEFKLNFNLATALKLGKNDKAAEELLEIAKQNIPAGQEAQCGKLIEEWTGGKYAIVL